MLLFLCVHWACVISTHGGVCVCVRQLALSAPCHKEAVTTGVWPASHPPARLTPLHLHPYSLACPATLLVALSLFRSALHMSLVSHGNLLSSIRSSCQLGFPSILPSLLSGPSTSLSVPLQWLHAPASHNQSLAHAHNHAKLMGTLSLVCGWKQRFVTCLLSAQHTRTSMLLHLHIPRQTKTHRHAVVRGPLSPLPDAVFCLWPHQLLWTKWQEKIKQCVIAFISLWLNYGEDSSAQILPFQITLWLYRQGYWRMHVSFKVSGAIRARL